MKNYQYLEKPLEIFRPRCHTKFMLLIFLDTETTGLNPEKHRAINIAFKILNTRNQQIVEAYETTIQQSQEVWANADPKSSEIHGFIYEDLLKGKPEKVVESEITFILNHHNIREETGSFVCQNPSFDRAFFNKIIKVEMQEQYKWPYHWLDLASMYWAFRHLNAHDRLDLKENDLSKDSIAHYFGIPNEARPHRAINGVNHLIACYQKMFAKVPEHSRNGVES